MGTRIELLLAAPRSDLRGFLSSAWEAPVLLENLVVQGERMTAVVGHLDDVADVGWQTDVAETRKTLGAYGRSWWRFMNGRCRRAKATLRGILRSAPPAGLDDQLLLLDRLSAAQEARRQITSASAPGGLGAQAFGSLSNCHNGHPSGQSFRAFKQAALARLSPWWTKGRLRPERW